MIKKTDDLLAHIAYLLRDLRNDAGAKSDHEVWEEFQRRYGAAAVKLDED